MKIKIMLVSALFSVSSGSFGADAAKPESAPAAKSKAAVPTAKAKPKAATTPKAAAKPKAKAKTKAKKKKKPAPKVTKPEPAEPGAAQEPEVDPAVIAAATNRYKKELAEKIVQAAAAKVHEDRPQALLRSVVVLEFAVDADGKLVRSAVRRSNRDSETEAIALASLRAAAPLPKPPAVLVRHGPVELHETWLFNNDGRFQIRSTAKEQLDRR